MSATVSCTVTRAESEHHSTNPMEIDISAFQDIMEKNINPAKLVALLRRRFGAGTYEIHVRCLY